ncbi:MAG: DUF4286 family protein [Calditrichaeota bacterium]|nr:DUF4286 family protein [Calditrichota bacterium]
MIIYEVNIDVDRSISREYQVWLEKHIRSMLEIDGFEKASLFERTEESDPKTLSITTHYQISSMEQLEAYFSKHAEKMRADGIRHFGDLFQARRRVLSLQNEY